MGSIMAATKQARVNINKNKAIEKYGSDVGNKLSSEDYAAGEQKLLASENEGKRLFNGKGSYAKAGKDDKFTMDEGTSIGKGVTSRETNVAGLFGTKRQRLFS